MQIEGGNENSSSPVSVLEASDQKLHATCIILTKDNAQQLIATFASVISQKTTHLGTQSSASHYIFYEILIIDSSQVQVTIPWLMSKIIQHSHSDSLCFQINIAREYPPLGIYSAMNLGLKLSRGEALIFMNSGDLFYDSYSLQKLIYARQSFRSREGNWPRIIFGQALIVPSSRCLPSWLVPDAKVFNISKWLKLFAPNHQTMLVDSEWARQNHFTLNSPHGADLAWIRSAFSLDCTYIYLREPIAKFMLGGISSKLPGIKILRLRLSEPSRTKLEKILEILKFFLLPFEPFYPLLMNIKSHFIGYLF